MTGRTAQTFLLFVAATISALTNATVGRSAENVPPGTSVVSDTAGESAGASIPQVQPAEQNTQDFPAEVAEFESVTRSDLTDAVAGDDPAFSRYVDFTLLERAMSNLNASLLADVALELAEGERVLVRPHKCGLTSDKLVAKAAALALRMNDPETIKRLEQAADALKKPAWTKALADANEFGGKSRDPGPSVSLGALEPNVVELANAVRRATDAAVLTSNKDDLESLKASVSESVKDEKIKTYLIQSIDTSLKALPEKPDPGDEALAEFASMSRHTTSRLQVCNTSTNTIYVAFLLGYSEGVDWDSWGESVARGFYPVQPGQTATLYEQTPESAVHSITDVYLCIRPDNRPEWNPQDRESVIFSRANCNWSKDGKLHINLPKGAGYTVDSQGLRNGLERGEVYRFVRIIKFPEHVKTGVFTFRDPPDLRRMSVELLSYVDREVKYSLFRNGIGWEDITLRPRRGGILFHEQVGQEPSMMIRFSNGADAVRTIPLVNHSKVCFRQQGNAIELSPLR